jgi:hypothetical protein
VPFTDIDFKRAQTIFEIWNFLKSPTFGQPLKLPTYTLLTLPPATEHAGGLIYVSDAASGAKFKGSDSVSWVNLG